MEQRLVGEIASVKRDVGSLKTDMVSVQSDVVSLRSEVVSMEMRLLTAIDHTQEALAQVVERGFEDTASQLWEMRAVVGATAEAVDHDVPGWREGNNDADLLTGYRKDLDVLTTRVKELEDKAPNRR